ncbi:Dehydrogenase with different specificities [Candidatus Terasakiella magnetica]|nr:Dehydrogenase with different specificities [Candidatus Terasakiella magnetica]
MFSPHLPRAALVTGAARRVGRAIALDLAEAGFAVAVHYSHSEAEAVAVAAEITAGGGRAVTLAADLAQEGDTASLVNRATAALGPVGVLVNNASTFERDDALGATRASWDLHMEVNLRAPFVLTQAFARALPAGAEGVVVNMLDQRVWSLSPHFTSYTLSKAGLWTLTQTLALALAPHIRVVGIGPGPALPSRRQTQAQFDAQAEALPLRRGTTPEEICRTVRMLLASPSLTGQMIALDGGQHLCWGPGVEMPEE